MGFIKEAKQNVAKSHAERATSEGHSVFLYRFNVPLSSSGASGPVSGAAEVIETIEQAGWHLAEMAYDEQQSRHGAMMLLFRSK